MTPTDSPTSSVVTIASVGDLVALWPSLSDFAADLAVPYDTAKGMKRRGRISSDYFDRIVSAAGERSIAGVTYELLAKLHSRTPTEVRAS